MVEISNESVIVDEGWVMGADYLCGVWGNQKIPTGVIWIYRCTTKGVGQPPQILIADATNDVRKGAQELRQLDDEYHAPGVYKFENYMVMLVGPVNVLKLNRSFFASIPMRLATSSNCSTIFTASSLTPSIDGRSTCQIKFHVSMYAFIFPIPVMYPLDAYAKQGLYI